MFSVRLPPKITKQPKSLDYNRGTDYVLDCEYEGTPHPQSSWLKNGENFDISGDIVPIGGNTGSIHFTNLDPFDEGTGKITSLHLFLREMRFQTTALYSNVGVRLVLLKVITSAW